MRKISDTIARLAALRTQHTTPAGNPGANDRLQAFEGFGSNPGALKTKRHLPEDLPDGAPLVVVLHGCTQSASSYDYHSGWSQLADEAGFALLYPEQQRGNNPNLCFNWFQPADARRGSGEALSIRQMIEAMVAAHSLDRKRIFITGLSAGGAMAAAMLASYPEVFAAGAIIAGLPCGIASTVPEAFDRMRGHGGQSERDLQRFLRGASDHRGPWPRMSIWHGSADHTVAPSNAPAIAGQWRGVHALERVPTHTMAIGRNSKQVWSDDTGRAIVEINMIAGMGHGAPLADGLGTPGAYMLNVGISSTREIADFWGIEAREQSFVKTTRHEVPARVRQRPSDVPDMERPKTMLPEPAAINRFPRDIPSGAPIKKTIEDALRAAGLMR